MIDDVSDNENLEMPDEFIALNFLSSQALVAAAPSCPEHTWKSLFLETSCNC